MFVDKIFFKEKKLNNKLFKFFLGLFIILIPFHTRWIIFDMSFGDWVWEYGRVSLYLNVIVLALAAVFFALDHKKEFYFSKNKFLYFLFAYSIIVSFYSVMPLVSFYYLLFVYLAVLFAYLLKFSSKLFIFRAFLFSGFIQASLALWQLFAQSISASKWLGIAQHLPATLGTAVLEYGDIRLLRAYGALPHPNILGGFLLVAIFSGIYLWINFYAHRISEQKEKISKKVFLELIMIVFALVICSLGLLASFSRSALLALFLSLFSTLLVTFFKRKWLVVSMILKYFIMLILLLAIFNYWWPGAWASRFNTNSRLEQKSVSERVDTLDQLDWTNYHYGFFGQGLGMNTLVTYQKYPELQIYEVQPIHDIFILMLAELGMVGAFLLFNVVRLIIKSANKVDVMSTSLILGLIIIGLFDHYLWTSWTGWLLMSFSLINLYKVERLE